ncbi:MAG: tRNA 2-thiouridine(34) synthase MnmA [Clostridiales bacterium]|nr:tRNA 2-thiouridine(34) synthase MnmA [Clostridiales bacterium]
MSKGKVVVGMSGGVDSSVAAYLLKEQGYDVIGVTMQIWQEENWEDISDNGGCCGLSAVDDARRVADSIGIPHYVMNFRRDFEKSVIKYFVNEYKEGKTPNPCIACNRYVKWEALLSRAKQIGADYIATGHYARIEKYPKTGRLCVCSSVTQAKDQTYALFNLTQEQLSSTLMPVGNFTKEQIREIAKSIDLQISLKPDSQDICFVPDGDYASFIEKYDGTKFPEGDFVDMNGNVLGRHKGIIHYTVGQRKGLGLALGKHIYVHHIDVINNRVVLCDNEELFGREVTANNINFMAVDHLDGEARAEAKIRYSHKKAPCTVKMENGLLKCTFDEPQRAVTPGQSLVVYDGDYILCGGTIQ